MADTGQYVFWSLEMHCEIREGIGTASRDVVTLTTPLHEYAKLIAEGNTLDGICVTGIVGNTPLDLPYCGEQISSIFGKWNGLDHVRNLCRDCPANVRDKNPDTVAGCGSFIRISPSDSELERSLRRLISRLGLDAEFRSNFLQTTPIWYGLWSQSPLTRKQCELLARVFSVFREQSNGGAPEFAAYFVPNAYRSFASEKLASEMMGLHAFSAALATSLEKDLPLHVSLPPPGHTDFGFSTVFAHCPRCKSGAENLRWKTPLPKSKKCQSCGLNYDPNSTYSQTKDDFGHHSLYQTLSPEAYLDFCRRYLLKKGHESVLIETSLREWKDRHAHREPRSEIPDASEKASAGLNASRRKLDPHRFIKQFRQEETWGMRILASAFDWLFSFDKCWMSDLSRHLRDGDPNVAVVVSTSPLVIAAYTDLLDAVLLFRFPETFEVKPKLGARLLAVNLYAAKGEMAPDIRPGPSAQTGCKDFWPLIAEFASDDEQKIESLKASIPETVWSRAFELGQKVLKDSNCQMRAGCRLLRS